MKKSFLYSTLLWENNYPRIKCTPTTVWLTLGKKDGEKNKVKLTRLMIDNGIVQADRKKSAMTRLTKIMLLVVLILGFLGGQVVKRSKNCIQKTFDSVKVRTLT